MRITREKHMAYIVKLMPFLLIALVAQCYVYMQWAPYDIALDISIFTGIGLVLTAAGFALYDHFHKVQLHRNHLVVKFALMNYEEEILYRNIQELDVEVTKQAYYNVRLTMKDGSSCKLYYLDDVQDLKSFIKAAA